MRIYNTPCSNKSVDNMSLVVGQEEKQKKPTAFGNRLLKVWILSVAYGFLQDDNLNPLRVPLWMTRKSYKP